MLISSAHVLTLPSNRRTWIAALLLAVPAVPVIAAELLYSASLRVNETFTNNVDFTDRQDRESGYATEILPDLDVDVLGARVGLELSYRMRHTRLHQPDERSQTTSLVNSNLRAVIIPNKVFLRGSLNYGDRAFRGLRLGQREGEGLAARDQGTFGVINLRPTWYELLAGKYVNTVGYHWSASVGDDGFGPETRNHRLTWSLANTVEDSRLQWRLRARQRYDGKTGDLERQQLAAGAGWYLSDEFVFLGRIGNEKIENAAITNFRNGGYWSLGFNWLIQPGIELGVLVGDTDRQVQLSLKATPRTSFVLGALDRDVGLDSDSRSYFGGLLHYGRFSTLRSIYSETYIDGNGLTLSLLNPGQTVSEGSDIVSIDFGNGLTGFGELEVITGQAIRHTWENSFSYQRARNSLTANYQLDRITPLAGQSSQRAVITALTAARRHARRWRSTLFGQWSSGRVDGNSASEFTTFGYRLNRSVNRSWQAGVQLERRVLHRRADADISENRLVGFLRYDFDYRGSEVTLREGQYSRDPSRNPRYLPNQRWLRNARGSVNINAILDDFGDFSRLQAERDQNVGDGLFDSDERFDDGFERDGF